MVASVCILLLAGVLSGEDRLTDGGDVVQQRRETVVIRNNLRSHTVLRYLCVQSMETSTDTVFKCILLCRDDNFCIVWYQRDEFVFHGLTS